MMELKSHLLHLESWAREELAAQRRIMEHVVSQEDALRVNDRTAFEDATAAIQREAEAGLERRVAALASPEGRARRSAAHENAATSAIAPPTRKIVSVGMN